MISNCPCNFEDVLGVNITKERERRARYWAVSMCFLKICSLSSFQRPPGTKKGKRKKKKKRATRIICYLLVFHCKAILMLLCCWFSISSVFILVILWLKLRIYNWSSLWNEIEGRRSCRHEGLYSFCSAKGPGVEGFLWRGEIKYEWQKSMFMIELLKSLTYFTLLCSNFFNAVIQMEFMLDTICDIKNNKKRPKEDTMQHTRIKKWLQKVGPFSHYPV